MEAKSGGKGCIKNTRGPWKVKKMTKDGQVATKLRFPSERERLQSSQRERQRRSIRHKIFAGLRSLGNYELPKHADTNDLLKALCREAGWHVDEDGTISKKGFFSIFYRDEDDQCARSEVISSNSKTYEPHDFLKSFSNN